MYACQYVKYTFYAWPEGAIRPQWSLDETVKMQV
jgi:hypothetical protein